MFVFAEIMQTSQTQDADRALLYQHATDARRRVISRTRWAT